MTRAAAIIAICFMAAPAMAQQPRRDRRPPPGSAEINGVVLSDERPPKPLRRARVTLNGSELTLGRTVITADDGTFAFDRLGPGTYTLSASKDAYVTLNYGARRPGRPGTSVSLKSGERRQVRVLLPRGAVITGTITDHDGQPAAGISVGAMAYRYIGGERRPVTEGATAALTDDRGVYRIFGLPAGEYIITAQARDERGASELQVMSAADVRAALAEVRDPFARGQSRTPGMPVIREPIATEPRETVTLAPVYYPGTAMRREAAFVAVGPTEERRGVDFPLESVPTARIGGTLFTPPGWQAPTITLSSSGDGPAAPLRRSAVPGPDGQFLFNAIPPGQYALLARMFLPADQTQVRAANAAPNLLWGSAEVSVDGADVLRVVIAMQPAVTIAGRVVFEGLATPPALDGLRVPLPAALPVGGMSVPLPALQLEAGGRFTIAGIIPGPYRLSSIMQGLRRPIGSWWLKSIVIDGHDMLDVPLDLRQGTGDAVVTFSERATELRGRVNDAKGTPVSNTFVIVFGVDRSAWFFNSRRVAAVQPAVDGRYAIRNLPPGDYFVAAFDDLDPDEWYDPAVLERLTAIATRITLADAEQQTHNLVR